MTDDEIDQRFPHQVILPSACYAASEFRSIHAFCIGMSLADRGHVVLRNAQWHYVFCFSEVGRCRQAPQEIRGPVVRANCDLTHFNVGRLNCMVRYRRRSSPVST